MQTLIKFFGLSFLALVLGGMVGLGLAMLSNGFGVVPPWVVIVSSALVVLAIAISPTVETLQFLGMSCVWSLFIVAAPVFLQGLFGDGALFAGAPTAGPIIPATEKAAVDEIRVYLDHLIMFAARYILLLCAMFVLCFSCWCKITSDIPEIQDV